MWSKVMSDILKSNAQEATNDLSSIECQKQLEFVKQELSVCQTALADWKDKLVRVSADFENFRKRVAKDQVQWRQTAQRDVLLALLPIVDDFERALQQLQASQPHLEQWRAGITMTYKSLQKILVTFGVEPMTNYVLFDPEYHEAIAQVDVPNAQSGSIVEVLEQGYLLHGEVLRPAKVSVAK
jgi:molecular chaperone GrpE